MRAGRTWVGLVILMAPLLVGATPNPSGGIAGSAGGEVLLPEWPAEEGIGIRGKGGKQNLDNEFVRAARNQADPCEWLAEQYRKASSSQEQLKIQAAQKVFECRNKQKRKSS